MILIDRALGTVAVTADNGASRTWPLVQFEADPATCIAATGNGIKSSVPEKISAAQAMAVLDANGLLDAAEALIAHPDTPRVVKIFWQREHEFNRTSPALNSMAAMLGLSEAQLDDLFRAAAAIAV